MSQFSLVQNHDEEFPELPPGDVLVFGNRENAIAFCDYDGNLDRIYPNSKPNESERWVQISKDQDSTYAWHGDRRKEGAREYGKVIWN